MEHRTKLTLLAGSNPYTVIVEPWADEFIIVPGTDCQVIALNPLAPPSFGVEPYLGGEKQYQGALIVYVKEGQSTYEFWRGTACESKNPIPIPG
jgi:hypothetical protein